MVASGAPNPFAIDRARDGLGTENVDADAVVKPDRGKKREDAPTRTGFRSSAEVSTHRDQE